MDVLITGGAGFIGSHVAERFLKEGDRVTILDNLSAGEKANVPKGAKFVCMDVEDRNCEKVFKDGGFDLVIHLAAQISVAASMEDPHQDARSNVLGVVNMLELSRKYRVEKFVYASSAAVYGEKSALPVQETDELCPKSPYGISKLCGELYCEKWSEIYQLKTLIFRFSNVYGPRQAAYGDGSVVPSFIKGAVEKTPIRIHGDGEQTRDFVFVLDLAQWLVQGAKSRLTGIYNLSSNTRHSINELVDTLGQLYPELQVIHGPERPGDIRHSVLDSTRLRKGLRLSEGCSFHDGLRITCEAFR